MSGGGGAGERRYIRTGLDDAAAALAATSRLRASVSRMKSGGKVALGGSGGGTSMFLPPKTGARRTSLPEPAQEDSEESDEEDDEDDEEDEQQGSGAWRQGPGSPGRSVSPDGRRGARRESPDGRRGSGAGREDDSAAGSFGGLVGGMPSRIKPAAGERLYIRTGLDDAAAALAATSRLRASVSRMKAGGKGALGDSGGASYLLPPKLGGLARRLSGPDFGQATGGSDGAAGRRMSEVSGVGNQE